MMETDELGRLASIGGRRSLDSWRQTMAGVLTTAGARSIGWRTFDGWRQSMAGVLSTAGARGIGWRTLDGWRQAEQNQDGSDCRN